MSEKQHTSTPWHPIGHRSIGASNCTGSIAQTWSAGKGLNPQLAAANRDFILLACNSHDKLVEDKRKLVEMLRHVRAKAIMVLSSHVCLDHGTGPCSDRDNLTDACADIDRVLKEAGD